MNSVAARVPHPNPYVGPRAYQTGEQLYGRTRELAELRNLLIAERVVLFYAPSGAGKSSLIQAALVPELQRRRFRVRPVMRVGTQPPPDMPAGTNRYTFSVLQVLEGDQPASAQMPLTELATLNLATYLDRRRQAEGVSDEVLIFDQFEEVLTRDPTDGAAKLAFFVGLGDALSDRRRWALFALREDYLAGLDPYRSHLPSGLASFRLDLLGSEAARQAIQEPARAAGIDFTDAAAIRLVEDLRQVQVQRPDGTTTAQPGAWVEPVQLQVVCRSLWDGLAPAATAIMAADLVGVGDVNTALAAYYATQVAAVATAIIPERRIRDWCDAQLITASGIRGQVLQGQGTSGGLDNSAVQGLVDAHLVRAEERRGATWYELTHDRLIRPVREDNARWQEGHLQPWQRQAQLWADRGAPADLLLRGADLSTARHWVMAHRNEVTEAERAFLGASDAGQRGRRRNRLLAAGALGLVLLALLAVSLAAISANNAASDSARSASIAYQARATAEARRNDAEAAHKDSSQSKAVLGAYMAQVTAIASISQNWAMEAQARETVEAATQSQPAVATAQTNARATLEALAEQVAVLPGAELAPQSTLTAVVAAQQTANSARTVAEQLMAQRLGTPTTLAQASRTTLIPTSVVGSTAGPTTPPTIIAAGTATTATSIGDSQLLRGVTIRLLHNPPLADIQALLARLAKDGANSISLEIHHYISLEPGTPNIAMPPAGFDPPWLIYPDLGQDPTHPFHNTPEPELVAATIHAAHKLGLQVMLKPVIDSYQAGWRGDISVKKLAGDWNAVYKTRFLQRYVDMAKAEGVETLAIGDEMYTVTKELGPEFWIGIADWVRGQGFQGKLTYAANWGGWADDAEYRRLEKLWPHLDYIGVDAYYPLFPAGYTGPTDVDTLVGAWHRKGIDVDWCPRIDEDLIAISQSTGKPLIFTEVGYGNHQQAPMDPVRDARPDDIRDDQLQLRLAQALRQKWGPVPQFHGYFWWEAWLQPPTQPAISHDILDKPIEKVLFQPITRR